MGGLQLKHPYTAQTATSKQDGMAHLPCTQHIHSPWECIISSGRDSLSWIIEIHHADLLVGLQTVRSLVYHCTLLTSIKHLVALWDIVVRPCFRFIGQLTWTYPAGRSRHYPALKTPDCTSLSPLCGTMSFSCFRPGPTWDHYPVRFGNGSEADPVHSADSAQGRRVSTARGSPLA